MIGMKLAVCLFVLWLGVVCQARHVHPSNSATEDVLFDNFNNGEMDQTIGVLNFKPTRFVPINDVLFFKSNEPCEDGFKRDVFGICREVWD